MFFLCFHRWRSRQRQAQHHTHPEAGVGHERQHLPPDATHLERRLRGLALLHRGRTTILPPEKTSKPDSARIRRVDGIFHQFRPLLVVLSSGLATTSINAQTRWRRVLRGIQSRLELVRARSQEDASVELHAAAGFERRRQEPAPLPKPESKRQEPAQRI